MRRYRTMGFPSQGAGLPAFSKPAPSAPKSEDKADSSMLRTNPVAEQVVKAIIENNNTSPAEKNKQVKEVVKQQPVKVIETKPSNPVAVSPAPVFPIRRDFISPKKPVTVIPVKPPVVAPKPAPSIPDTAPRPAPTPILTPSPSPGPIDTVPGPVVVSPSPSIPRTSIRVPEAIVRASPRVYSQNRRVSFRAPRLTAPTLNRPPMRKLMPRPTKQKWTPMKPVSRSFMNRVRPGQFSFQSRGVSRLPPRHTHSEIRRLQMQVNKLNADALKTTKTNQEERAALENQLKDYQMSPVTQVRDNAKGLFSVVDKASRFATPSINGMNGFPSVSEESSKALAVGFGLLTALFIIGRVE